MNKQNIIIKSGKGVKKTAPRVNYSGLIIRVAVSVALRNAIIKWFPELLANRSLLRLLAHLLNSTLVDEDSKSVLIPCKLLAALEGKAWNRRYSAKRFLEEFASKICNLEYSWWSYSQKKCRCVTKFEFPPELWVMWWADSMTDGEKVDLVTGREVTIVGIKEERLKIVNHHRKWMNPEAVEVMDYMNTPDDFFEQLKERIPVALKSCDGEIRSIQHVQRIMRNFVLYGQPILGPSNRGKTVRLFEQLIGLSALPKKVREVLFAGCTEIDLVGAHFAINAHLWGLKKVIEWLAQVADIWEDFVGFVQGDPRRFNDIKKALKEITYGLWYGMELRVSMKKAKRELADLGCKVNFFTHPIIQEIVVAREIALDNIRREKFAVDIYGKKLKLNSSQDEKSITAQLAQAVELKLMFGVIEVAKTTKDFRVVSWLHDGCTIKFNNNKDFWLKAIKEAISNKGKTLGMNIKIKDKELVENAQVKTAVEAMPVTVEKKTERVETVAVQPSVPSKEETTCDGTNGKNRRFVIDKNITNYQGLFEGVRNQVEQAGRGEYRANKLVIKKLAQQLEAEKVKLNELYNDAAAVDKIDAVEKLRKKIDRLDKKHATAIKRGTRNWYDDVLICVPNAQAAANLAAYLGWNCPGEVCRAVRRIKTYFELGVTESYRSVKPNHNLYSQNGKMAKVRQSEHIIFPFLPDSEVLYLLSEGWSADATVWILHDNLDIEHGNAEVRPVSGEGKEAVIRTDKFTSDPLPDYQWRMRNKK